MDAQQHTRVVRPYLRSQTARYISFCSSWLKFIQGYSTLFNAIQGVLEKKDCLFTFYAKDTNFTNEGGGQRVPSFKRARGWTVRVSHWRGSPGWESFGSQTRGGRFARPRAAMGIVK
jgi:hypothetical protein